MEGIVNIIKKEEDIKKSLGIVKDIITDLDESLIYELTLEIMDTSLNIGGDFSEENIKNITQQYVELGGIKRFLSNKK